MAKIAPAPIREDIATLDGKVDPRTGDTSTLRMRTNRVWVQWFTDQFNRINERIEQITDVIAGNIPLADADGSLTDSGYTPTTLPHNVHTHEDDDEGGTLDHGDALTGLAGDDHTQYLLAAGTRDAAKLHIGGAVNYTDFDADGVLTLHGTARVNKIQVIHLSAMKKGVGSPPGEGLKDGFPTYDFDNVADEEVFFSFTTPDDYNVSTDMSLHAQFFVDTAPVAAAGVAWVIEWKATAEGETIDFTAGTATVLHAHPVTTGTPANDALRLDCNELIGGAGGIAAGDLIQCRLYRDVSDAGDTFAGDARLIGVHVHYTGNKLGIPT